VQVRRRPTAHEPFATRKGSVPRLLIRRRCRPIDNCVVYGDKIHDTRTRQLLGLLADDAVDGLIAELEMAAATELALRRVLGVSHAALQTRLSLHALGVLDYETQRTDAPGRPGRVWHSRDPQTLGQFAKSAALLRRKVSQ
jgi:hypothetical protein